MTNSERISPIQPGALLETKTGLLRVVDTTKRGVVVRELVPPTNREFGTKVRSLGEIKVVPAPLRMSRIDL